MLASSTGDFYQNPSCVGKERSLVLGQRQETLAVVLSSEWVSDSLFICELIYLYSHCLNTEVAMCEVQVFGLEAVIMTRIQNSSLSIPQIACFPPDKICPVPSSRALLSFHPFMFNPSFLRGEVLNYSYDLPFMYYLQTNIPPV